MPAGKCLVGKDKEMLIAKNILVQYRWMEMLQHIYLRCLGTSKGARRVNELNPKFHTVWFDRDSIKSIGNCGMF